LPISPHEPGIQSKPIPIDTFGDSQDFSVIVKDNKISEWWQQQEIGNQNNVGQLLGALPVRWWWVRSWKRWRSGKKMNLATILKFSHLSLAFISQQEWLTFGINTNISQWRDWWPQHQSRILDNYPPDSSHAHPRVITRNIPKTLAGKISIYIG
jgi:hypothetical protein